MIDGSKMLRRSQFLLVVSAVVAITASPFAGLGGSVSAEDLITDPDAIVDDLGNVVDSSSPAPRYPDGRLVDLDGPETTTSYGGTDPYDSGGTADGMDPAILPATSEVTTGTVEPDPGNIGTPEAGRRKKLVRQPLRVIEPDNDLRRVQKSNWKPYRWTVYIPTPTGPCTGFM